MSLSGSNGKKFGEALCKNWGFDNCEFLGRRAEYEKFMKAKDLQLAATWPPICEPEFQIAGGICRSKNIDKVSLLEILVKKLIFSVNLLHLQFLVVPACKGNRIFSSIVG